MSIEISKLIINPDYIKRIKTIEKPFHVVCTTLEESRFIYDLTCYLLASYDKFPDIERHNITERANIYVKPNKVVPIPGYLHHTEVLDGDILTAEDIYTREEIEIDEADYVALLNSVDKLNGILE